MAVRWRSALLTFVGTVAIALAGCFVAPPTDIENAFPDAGIRFHEGVVSGETGKRHAVTVPTGTTFMRVALTYDISGEIDVTLTDPAGTVRHAISAGGDSEDDAWFNTASPTPGTWHIETSLEGSGGYTIGVYL